LSAKKRKSNASRKASAAKKKAAEKKAGDGLVDQRLMKALSHPLRVRCLTLINNRPWSPRELSDELGEGLSQVSYHIKVLRDFELIQLCGEEPRRGAVEHYYRAVHRVIVPEGLAAQLPKSARSELVGKVLTDIEQDVGASFKAGTFDARDDYHISWTPMQLDEQGCKDVAAKTDRLMEELLDVQAESDERLANGSAESTPISAAILVFGSARGPEDKRTASSRKRG